MFCITEIVYDWNCAWLHDLNHLAWHTGETEGIQQQPFSFRKLDLASHHFQNQLRQIHINVRLQHCNLPVWYIREFPNYTLKRIAWKLFYQEKLWIRNECKGNYPVVAFRHSSITISSSEKQEGSSKWQVPVGHQYEWVASKKWA